MTILTILSIIAITESKTTVYAEEDTKKELCKENGGKWEDNACDFKTDDEDKGDQFIEDIEKIENFEEEKASLEDALCDDEDAETTNIKICQSVTLAFASIDSDEDEKGDDNQVNTKEEDEEFAKELCESDTYKGEWVNGECTNFPGGQSSASIGYGDECESSDFQREHPYFCKVKE